MASRRCERVHEILTDAEDRAVARFNGKYSSSRGGSTARHRGDVPADVLTALDPSVR